MEKKSAGILLYRTKNKIFEVLLVHPGGPFFQKKDLGAWSIPKGEFSEEESAKDAALREFHEELGVKLDGPMIELTPIKQKSGKWVYAWALEGDIDPENIICNTFSIEWPPKSGLQKEFPEIDKGEWFTIGQAKEKINTAQFSILEELIAKLNIPENQLSHNVVKKTAWYDKPPQPEQLDLF